VLIGDRSTELRRPRGCAFDEALSAARAKNVLSLGGAALRPALMVRVAIRVR